MPIYILTPIRYCEFRSPELCDNLAGAVFQGMSLCTSHHDYIQAEAEKAEAVFIREPEWKALEKDK